MRHFIAPLPALIGEQVSVCGFVETVRDQKRMQFIVLRDKSGSVQIVHEKSQNPALADVISSLTNGSAITVSGKIVANPQVKLGGV